MSRNDILSRVKVLYDYSNLALTPRPADILIVMGTNDLGVAQHAAKIDRLFDYPLIFVSGGVSHQLSLRKEPFGGTEAEIMAKTMIDIGVPSSKIFLEKEAKNTGDNITLVRTLLNRMGKKANTGHLVHTPPMQLRALATAEKQWPNMQWSVSSENTPLETYILGLNENQFIEMLVGNVFRILDYANKGFQTPKNMPLDVKDALRDLVSAGFNRRVPEDFNVVLDRS